MVSRESSAAADAMEFTLPTGRVLRPYLPTMSNNPPTPHHLFCTEKLQAFMGAEYPQENEEEQEKRHRVITTLTQIFKDWVAGVCRTKGLPEEVACRAGGFEGPRKGEDCTAAAAARSICPGS